MTAAFVGGDVRSRHATTFRQLLLGQSSSHPHGSKRLSKHHAMYRSLYIAKGAVLKLAGAGVSAAP